KGWRRNSVSASSRSRSRPRPIRLPIRRWRRRPSWRRSATRNLPPVAKMIASGERVALVRPRMSDRNEFLAALSRRASLLGPGVAAPATPQQWSAGVRRMRAPDARAFLLRRHGDRALVGVVNLNTIIFGGLRQAFVGYYAFLPHGGEGYMTEGLDLVVGQ